MRRLVVVGITVVAIACMSLGASGASGDHRAGAVARGGSDLKLTYVVRLVNGKPSEIRKFKFRRLTATCSEGPLDLKGRYPRMNINRKRKFHGVLRKQKLNLRVRGKLSRNGRKQNGVLRASGDFETKDGQRFSDCTTGKVPWSGASS